MLTVQHEAVTASYLKDPEPEKACQDKAAKVISVKDPENSCANTAARSRKIYKKDLEKSYESLK